MNNYLTHGESYASDLLDWVGIPKKTNKSLFTELSDLFNGFNKEDIQETYQDIMFLCELPNGQMRGKLPQLYEIKKLLNSKKKNKVNSPKVFKDYAMICPQCGAAFSIGQYRCLDGYVIKKLKGEYTQAIPCRDGKDSKVGPMLKKEKLEVIPSELMNFNN